MSKFVTPSSVEVIEVGVRDGLQNESRAVSFEDKLWLAQSLIRAGIKNLELGAFVRPDRVPQMADTPQMYAAVKAGTLKLKGARAWALVANQKGLDRALEAGVKNIAIFTAATDSFAKKNIGLSVAESLQEFKSIALQAQAEGVGIRGYVSTVFGCPFEGKVAPAKALKVIEKLAKLGVDEISVGDTIGVATPKGVDAIVQPGLKLLGKKQFAVHFHDTRGTALANTLRSLEHGVSRVDASAGGLGGCPFAPGATGNLATEDLVYMLHGMGIKTGIKLEELAKTSLEFSKKIGRPLTSRYLAAFAANGAAKRGSQ